MRVELHRLREHGAHPRGPVVDAVKDRPRARPAWVICRREDDLTPEVGDHGGAHSASDRLSDTEKFDWQGYITRCYGSMTTFNVLFRRKEDQFHSGAGGS